MSADYEVTGPSQMVAPPSTLPPTYTHKLYLPVVFCSGCNGIPSLNEPLLNLAAARVTYRFNGQQVAVREGVTLTFIYGDHLGSASVTVNLSGTKVSEVRYYPFGETRYSSGNTASPKRFTSQEEQIGIGLYDYGARFYDPAIGRFVSADSVVPKPGNPQSLNRYAYARNSPVMRIDPSGHGDIVSDILDFIKGASMQYNDDISLGAQSALNVDVKHEFETNGNFAFIAGREWGRTASTLQGINESISGGSMMIGGLIVGSGVAVLGCAGVVTCPAAAGGGAALGTTIVVAGTVEAAHGLAMLGSAAGRPVPSTAMLAKAKRGSDNTLDNWGDRSTLQDHFDRHGAGVGANSEQEYVRQSQQFRGQRWDAGVRSKTEANGVVRVWNPKTNLFGSYNGDGTTRTFMTLDLEEIRARGYNSYRAWWDAQPGW